MTKQNIPFKVETWQPDADGFAPTLCSDCGTPVRYGSRHGHCLEPKKPAPRIDYRAECWPDSPHAKGDRLREQVLAHVLKRGAGAFNLADKAVVSELVELVRHFGGTARP